MEQKHDGKQQKTESENKNERPRPQACGRRTFSVCKGVQRIAQRLHACGKTEKKAQNTHKINKLALQEEVVMECLLIV